MGLVFMVWSSDYTQTLSHTSTFVDHPILVFVKTGVLQSQGVLLGYPPSPSGAAAPAVAGVLSGRSRAPAPPAIPSAVLSGSARSFSTSWRRCNSSPSAATRRRRCRKSSIGGRRVAVDVPRLSSTRRPRPPSPGHRFNTSKDRDQNCKPNPWKLESVETAATFQAIGARQYSTAIWLYQSQLL